MIGGDETNENQYGIELILDLHGCDVSSGPKAQGAFCEYV